MAMNNLELGKNTYIINLNLKKYYTFLDDNYHTKANPLHDLDFINKLHYQQIRITYAKIIALDLEEEPIESIEGIVTQGSVNVDGSSAVRRTCSLTLVAKELNIHEYYWGLRTKVEIYAGLENRIDDNYPDIIWFKLGVFVLSNFSTTQGLGNYTISLQGKDKMVLLNGEMGGMITSLTHDFGKARVVGEYTKQESILIKDIIQAAVHTFAKMPYYKIIINDLDEMGLELMEYNGKDPIYVIIDNQNRNVLNLTLNNIAFKKEDGSTVYIKDIEHYDPLFDLEQSGVVRKVDIVYDALGTECTVAKLTSGMTAGYRLTDLVYAGDLIMNVGETITAMLNKIVTMLGEFEYYFDLDGNFVFLHKQVYLLTSWTGIKTDDNNEIWVEPNAFSSAITYSFTDAKLITNYLNQPDFNNVKNDFAIWGTRKSAAGAEIPIHLRYAIDIKPKEYVTLDGVRYLSNETIEVTETTSKYTKEELEQLKVTYDKALDIAILLRKNHNPFNFPGDWWDISDWAALWNLTLGYIPTAWMNLYSAYPRGTFSVKDLGLEISPSFLSQWNSYYKSYYYETLRSGWHLIHLDSEGRLKSLLHSTGCSHPYYDADDRNFSWLPLMLRYGDLVYIINPVFPSDLEERVLELLNVIPEYELAINGAVIEDYSGDTYDSTVVVDWRELIYQMALDYKAHHSEDEFYINVFHRNPETCPNGITGYELYYTDLDGFWRELYDPFYTASYDAVSVSQSVYLAKINAWYLIIGDEVANDFEFPYYISTPLYEPGKLGDSYYENLKYFVRDVDVLTNQMIYKEVRIDLDEFLSNPTMYYHISDKNKNYIPAMEDEFYGDDTRNLWYVRLDETEENNKTYLKSKSFNLTPTSATTIYGGTAIDNSYIRIARASTFLGSGFPLGTYNLSQMIETAHETEIIKNDIIKMVDISYIPCFKARPINTSIYYRYTESDKLIAGVDIKDTETSKLRTEYFNNPQKFWHENWYDYHLCTSTEDYNPEIKAYYKRDVDITGTLTEAEYTYSAVFIKDLESFNNQYKTEKTDAAGNVITTYLLYTRSERTTPLKISCCVANIPDSLKSGYSIVNENNINFINAIDKYKLGEQSLTDVINVSDIPGRTVQYNPDTGYRLAFIDEINDNISNQRRCWMIVCKFVPYCHPSLYDGSIIYYTKRDDDYDENHWAYNVSSKPETLNFWFDFLDEHSELVKYSNHAIGNRPKAINDNTVKSIYFRETPTVLFKNSGDKKEVYKSGYTTVSMDSSLLSLFSLSGRGKSAKTALDNMLYKDTWCAESISFLTLPYYNLEPNKRIYVACPESGITGEYIMTKFNVPLGPSSNMTINAVLAVDALY